MRDRRTKPLVTVTRGWRLHPDVAGVWRVSVVNRSPSRALTVTRVWLEASRARNATPLDWAKGLPRTLSPREAWQGFVADEIGLMDGIDDPFRVSNKREKNRARSCAAAARMGSADWRA
jgi:hypothetical protein